MSGNPRRSNGSRRDALLKWLRAQARPCWICGLPIDYGAAHGSPWSFECDEIVPVSRGGSPFDRSNVDAAHRCCNNWRRAKPALLVAAVRAAALSRFGPWSTPERFVALAKAVERDSARPPVEPPETTTEW